MWEDNGTVNTVNNFPQDITMKKIFSIITAAALKRYNSINKKG